MTCRFLRPLLLGITLTGWLPAGWAAGPEVVATVGPVHSLVAGVMEGVGEPEQLISGGASPHAYSLRPSAVRMLHQAELVFWVGEELETFLTKTLEGLPDSVDVVALGGKGAVKLEVREGGVWAEHEHAVEQGGENKHEHESEHEHAAGQAEEHEHEHDPHYWLDPENARMWVKVVAGTLSRIDPDNGEQYRTNAAALDQRLRALGEELLGELEPVRTRPYVVFHDAYQYFEHRFGLSPVGSITMADARAPGARRIAGIRRAIRERGAVCVFAEPQFEPRLVKTVIEGSGAKGAVLDPVGARLEPGPDLYFNLMREMSRNLAECLS